ncbi:MAG TPA: glycosyltransferase [Pirellulales bacterium]|nr:glycosyltransferase [Pirellulales bacterium]
MKISVAVVTYNHEPYIRQALDSVFAQQTSHDYEVVIGDDRSTDDTHRIVQEYAGRQRDRVQLLLHEQNLGCTRNAQRTINACRGEYLALIDGDDYWTDPLKLQRQADYLDAHPTCALSFHQVAALDEQGQHDWLLVPDDQPGRCDMAALLADAMVPTGSMMMRRRCLSPLPDWFGRAYPPDLALKALCADQGTLDYLEQTMSVYRQHGGSWTSTGQEQRLQAMIGVYGMLQRHFGGRYRRWLRRAMAKQHLALAVEAEKRGDPGLARRRLFRALAIAPLGKRFAEGQWRTAARLLFPRIYRSLKHGHAAAEGTPS